MKYGYRMFDCEIKDLYKYKQRCYDSKKEPNPSDVFSYKTFDSIQQAQSLIGHVLIPASARHLGRERWTLEGNMLIKEVTFDSGADANTYQTAIERAWAMGGHLDPRVEQSYHE